MKKITFVLVGIFVILSLFLLISGKINFTGNGVFSQNNNQEEIIIQLSQITEQSTWYEYQYGNTKIKYFAVKSKDGSVKTAFDACDVCFGSKKGYRQEGDYMICNNCGNKYPISGLGTENLRGGGCWPGYIPNNIDGESIKIKKSDLERGGYRFK
jgi:uncharacterized membrane protein